MYESVCTPTTIQRGKREPTSAAEAVVDSGVTYGTTELVPFPSTARLKDRMTGPHNYGCMRHVPRRRADEASAPTQA
jgi:hypothetical protein